MNSFKGLKKVKYDIDKSFDNPPKASVIINVHNGIKFIETTIQSILNQTYSDFELIVFNNASSDGTDDFLNSIDDKRIKVYRNEELVPLYKARNLAVEKANGKFIAFCDVDDLWFQTKLEEQIQDIEKSEDLISCTNFLILNERNTKKEYGHEFETLPKISSHDLIMNHPYIHMSSLLINRKVFTYHGIFFNPELTILGDMDFFVRCLKITNIRSIDNYLTIYRYHGENTGLIRFHEIYTEGVTLIKKYKEQKVVEEKILNQFGNRIEWFLLSEKAKNNSKVSLVKAIKNLSFINFLKLLLAIYIPKRIALKFIKRDSSIASNSSKKNSDNEKNILVIGNNAADSFGMHISDTLKIMGHEVHNFSYEPNTYEAKTNFFKAINKLKRFLFNIFMRSEKYRQSHFKKLYKILKKNEVDLVIVTHDYLYPFEVEKIRELSNARICLWYPDPICTMDRALFLGCNYDCIFLKEPFLVKKFRELTDLNIFYLPECFNPLAYDDVQKSLLDNDSNLDDSDLVAFGNFHPWRSLLLNRLLNFDLKFYGVDPPSWLLPSKLNQVFTGYPIFNQDKKNALLASPIVVNNMHFGEVWGISARIFETAGIGAFQITEANIGLDELYLPGEEIVTYSNKDDLKDVIQYYLDNPMEREKIARLGRLKTLKDHTYTNRLNLLISTVFNDDKGFPSSLIT